MVCGFNITVSLPVGDCDLEGIAGAINVNPASAVSFKILLSCSNALRCLDGSPLSAGSSSDNYVLESHGWNFESEKNVGWNVKPF